MIFIKIHYSFYIFFILFFSSITITYIFHCNFNKSFSKQKFAYFYIRFHCNFEQKFQRQTFAHFNTYGTHKWKLHPRLHTKKNQDFGFVAQMLMATNAIPYEGIQFQTLENTNSYSKKMERCFDHSIFWPLWWKMVHNAKMWHLRLQKSNHMCHLWLHDY